MEDTGKTPLFKKIDLAIFDRIDKFKQTPNYTPIQDFYNGFEEDQQRVFKGFILLSLFLLPLLLISVLWWQNSQIREDYDLRASVLTRANAILGQSHGVKEISPQILSLNPIESPSMMTTRLSTMLSGFGVDLSKIQVKDFGSAMISSTIMRAEAKISFASLSTDDLMNLFINLIQKEKFRIQSVSIVRNPDTNSLQGSFDAIHFSAVTVAGEEE